jgi:DNA processing protein
VTYYSVVCPLEVAPEDLLGSLNEVERKNAPERLYLAGNPGLLTEGSRISVVGTREVSREGLERTAILTKELVSQGITVVSGLAAGVDTIAHRTAIAEGGRTIAVIGTPLDKSYPRENAKLQEEIAMDNLLVSQFPPGYPAQRKNWPMRNRTMALLSDATIIVEAGEGSGTLHQGWEALRLGRPLLILESATKDPELSWPGEMMSYGAQILSRENLELFLEEIPQRTSRRSVAF